MFLDNKFKVKKKKKKKPKLKSRYHTKVRLASSFPRSKVYPVIMEMREGAA